MEMSKKIAVLLIGLCLVSLCGCGKESATAETSDGSGRSVSAVLSYTEDYEYTMYGVVKQVEILAGCDYDVISIQPLHEGGVPYEGYSWDTAFISKELTEAVLLDKDGGYKTFEWTEDEDGKSYIVDTCYRIEATYCEDGGAFVHLPILVLDIEEIAAEEIPVWGGQ